MNKRYFTLAAGLHVSSIPVGFSCGVFSLSWPTLRGRDSKMTLTEREEQNVRSAKFLHLVN